MALAGLLESWFVYSIGTSESIGICRRQERGDSAALIFTTFVSLSTVLRSNSLNESCHKCVSIINRITNNMYSY